MNPVLLSLGFSLLLTLAAELIFAWLWRVPRRDLPLVVLVNVLTNPVVVFLHTAVSLFLRPLLLPVTALLELAAFLTEGWFYHTRSDIRNPWTFSLCANLASYLTGLLLSA